MSSSSKARSTHRTASDTRGGGAPTQRDFLQRCLNGLARQRQTCRAPERATVSVLADVIDQAKGTRFGSDHALDRVRTLAEFKDACPISGYASLRPYIERIREGDAHALTADAPYAFLATSGTSGESKLIPTTRHWRDRYRGAALYGQWGLYFHTLRVKSLSPDSFFDMTWERNPVDPTKMEGALPVYSITKRPTSVSPQDWTPPWFDEPWFLGDGSDGGTLYRKMRILASSAVLGIVSVNPSRITALAQELNENADRLISDLRRGTLDGHPRPARLKEDPALAKRLEMMLRREGRLLLTDLWPSLRLLVAWNSASARFYRGWLEVSAPKLPVIPFSTTGTESIVTIPVDSHRSAGPLAIDQGIYEFVPVTEETSAAAIAPDAETLSYDELQVGAQYRLVMTQANGLYRYDLGDIYQVVGWVGRLPRLEFVLRAGTVASFTGEKLSESDVHTAMRAVWADTTDDLPAFTVVPVWGQPPHYRLLLEGDGSGERWAQRMDEELCRLNMEYAEKRGTHRLAPVQATVLPFGTFKRLASRRLTRASAAQVKHHWLQADARLLDELDSL